jgi:hypothetical protein
VSPGQPELPRALLERIARVLHDHQVVDFAFTGGVAVGVWSAPRQTKDIDLCGSIPVAEVDRLLALHDYVQTMGLCSESSYPYTGRVGICKTTCMPVVPSGLLRSFVADRMDWAVGRHLSHLIRVVRAGPRAARPATIPQHAVQSDVLVDERVDVSSRQAAGVVPRLPVCQRAFARRVP